jgi:SH3 domain-containing YSC84-like protein 1
MNVKNKRRSVLRGVTRVLIVATALWCGEGLLGEARARADDRADARQLVEKSKLTFANFMSSRDMGALRDLMRKARGVFIAPQVLKGAFIFGVSGGSGVFLARDGKTAEWSNPAFYTIGEVSFGLQAGGEASEVVFVALTDRGVSALLSNSVKLGADVGVAVGPVGVGADASTANISGDIITFSLKKGLYAGISLEGAVVATRGDWNGAYYGKKAVTATDILIRRSVQSQHSSSLVNAVAKAGTRR